MGDISAEALLSLSKDEEKTAIIGFLTANGEFRYTTIARFAAIQQRRSALNIGIQRVPLVQYSGVDANNRPVRSSGNNINTNDLDIRQGAQRHSFDDGYFAIEVHYQVRYSTNNGRITNLPTFIPIEALNAPESHTDHLPTFRQIATGSGGDGNIYRVSDTSFAIYLPYAQATYRFFRAIYGLKYTVA